MQFELYEQLIIEHSKRPHGRGLREPFNGEAHHVNPTCGDEVYVRVNVTGGVVGDLSYDGEGCSISRAAASVLHDLVNGRTVDDALVRNDAFVALVSGRDGSGDHEPDEELLADGVAFAGVARYPARVKCALLPWMAFKDALVRALASSAGGSSTGGNGSSTSIGSSAGGSTGGSIGDAENTTMVGGPA